MKPSHGLAKNFLFLVANYVLSPVFSMALVLAISRLKGVEMLGRYSLMMTVFTVGQSCATLGLTVIITREVAKERHLAGRYFINACALTGGLIILTLLALIPAVWASLADQDMRVAISLTLLSLVPSVVMGNGEGVLLAFERAGDYVAVGLTENVARAGVGTLLVLSGFGIPAIAVGLLAVRILAAILIVIMLQRRGVALSAPLDRELWRDLLIQVPVVGSITIVNQIYARSDVLLLTWFGTWRDVGLYSAGLRLVDIARTLPMAYSRALYPILSRLYGQHPGHFTTVMKRSLRQSLLMITPVTMLMSGLSVVVITIFYGPDAVGGATSFAILSCSLIPLAIACVFAQALLAAGRQVIDLRVNLAGAVVSIVANLLLIPRFGAAGAATSMLLSISVFAAIQYAWLRLYAFDPEALPYLAKAVGATLGGAAVITALLKTSVIAAVAAGLFTYAAAALVGGLVTRREIDALRAHIGSTGARRLWGLG